MRLLDHVGKLNGTEGDAEIITVVCNVQHAADTAAGEEHDLAGHQIRCARGARIDRPRQTVGTHEANGRRATLRNDDVGLIDDLGVACGCDAVLKDVALPEAPVDRLAQPPNSAVARKSARGITSSVFVIATVLKRSSEKRPIRVKARERDLTLDAATTSADR